MKKIVVRYGIVLPVIMLLLTACGGGAGETSDIVPTVGACGEVECKALPAGVYESAGPNDPVGNVVTSVAVKGVLLRVSWKVCGDDLNCLYDAVKLQLDKALSKNLHVALMIMDSDEAPAGVKSQCKTFDFSFRGNPATMCLAWDKNYLQDKQRLISELGLRFDSHPALAYVYFTGACSTNGAEGHCRVDQAAYTTAGYTPTVLADAYVQIMNMYRTAFPSTPIAFEVHAIFDSASVWNSVWDSVAQSGRVGVAAWWCAERLSLNGNETTPVWPIIQKAAASSFSVCQTVGEFSNSPYRFTDSTLALDYGLIDTWVAADSEKSFNETLDWAQGYAVHALQPATINRFSVIETWSVDLKNTLFQSRLLLF